MVDGARRLCVAADVEAYSRRSVPDQHVAQDQVRELLGGAWAGTDGVARQANGDGEVAIAPPGVDEAAVLVTLVRAVSTRLAAINEGAARRLRMRLAIHAGHAQPGANGFVGHGVVRACRMVSASAVRRALAEAPGTDLLVVVSESTFEDVVAPERHGLRAADFRALDLADAEKAFTARAYVLLCGPAPAVAPPPAPGERATFRVDVADGGRVGTVVQVGELHGGLHLPPLPP